MKSKKIHPLVTEANRQLQAGKITRRDFLKLSTLLGMSLPATAALASCSPTEAPPVAAPATAAPAIAEQATAVPPTTAPVEAQVPQTFVRGGILTAATRVERVDHPRVFLWLARLVLGDMYSITSPIQTRKGSLNLICWILGRLATICLPGR